MSLINNFKTLFGIGPLLLFMFLLIEGILIYVNQSIKLTIGLSFDAQVMITIGVSILLLAGLIWFNRTISLIQTSFMGRKKRLVFQGPFLYVRHPLYSTLMVTIPSFFLIWFNDYLFVLPWILIIFMSHLIIKVEERGLIREFGKSYQEYKLRVPALIPYRGAVGRTLQESKTVEK